MFKPIVIIICISNSSVLGKSFQNLGEKNSNPRIVGGEDANITDYPFTCSLRLNGEHNCGCNIINEKFLVTAAHCILGFETDSLSVTCGITNLNENGGGAQNIKVARTRTHPDYNSFFKVNDIAIIQIAQNLQFDDQIRSIELEDKCTSDKSVPCVIIGWGWTNYPESAVSNTLQKLNSRTETYESCLLSYSYLKNTHLCAYTKIGEGACRGDSGGPLIVNNKLYGIVSFGRPCAVGAPDVFTRIGCFKDWIVAETQLL